MRTDLKLGYIKLILHQHTHKKQACIREKARALSEAKSQSKRTDEWSNNWLCHRGSYLVTAHRINYKLVDRSRVLLVHAMQAVVASMLR